MTSNYSITVQSDDSSCLQPAVLQRLLNEALNSYRGGLRPTDFRRSVLRIRVNKQTRKPQVLERVSK